MRLAVEKQVRVEAVEPLEGYKLKVSFTDGTSRLVDFERDLKGPMFEPLKDVNVFRKVRVEYGTLVWPNGADVCPDALYFGGTPPWAQRALKKAAP